MARMGCAISERSSATISRGGKGWIRSLPSSKRELPSRGRAYERADRSLPGVPMNTNRYATVVAWVAIVVLLLHAIRGWVSQLRWVSAIVEIAAAGVIAWQWRLLSRDKGPPRA